uniref:Uncharacterized protein n=1 Tax=Anguilla anguilla TaxID=7936 RepID=A0A0E9TSF4_ANGAN
MGSINLLTNLLYFSILYKILFSDI